MTDEKRTRGEMWLEYAVVWLSWIGVFAIPAFWLWGWPGSWLPPFRAVLALGSAAFFVISVVVVGMHVCYMIGESAAYQRLVAYLNEPVE